MKKLSFITILFLCVFFCKSPASAIEVIYSATGTFYSTNADPYGWDETPFDVEFRIDSDTQHDWTVSDSDMVGYGWEVSDVSYEVDGADQDVTYASLLLERHYIALGLDQVSMDISFEKDGSINYLRLYAGYPFETFNNYDPFDLDQQLEFTQLLAPSRVESIVAGVGTHVMYYASGSFKANPVPEPATMLLLGSGLVGLAGFGRKRFKN